jgi:hypothetical protein
MMTTAEWALALGLAVHAAAGFVGTIKIAAWASAVRTTIEARLSALEAKVDNFHRPANRCRDARGHRRHQGDARRAQGPVPPPP